MDLRQIDLAHACGLPTVFKVSRYMYDKIPPKIGGNIVRIELQKVKILNRINLLACKIKNKLLHWFLIFGHHLEAVEKLAK